MKNAILLILSCMLCSALGQVKPVVYKGATIHTATGEVIENGYIEIQNGKISAIAKNLNPEGKQVVDVSGKHIYPGLFSLYTSLGLSEIDLVRQSNDHTEVGEFNAHIRSLIAYNTDSDIIPVIRSAGVLYAQVTPRGSVLPGSSSVVHLEGWSWEEALYKADEGLHLNWPGYYPPGYFGDGARADFKANREKSIAAIKKFFDDARIYNLTKNPAKRNIRLQATRGLFEGSQNLYIVANEAKEIVESVLWAKDAGIKKIVLVGAKECLPVVDFIKQHHIPVILYRTHDLPSYADGDTEYAYKLPSILTKAGITVAISYYGDMEVFHSRNIPFTAGTTAAYGLNKEEALQLITLNAAKIIGVDKTTGSLEAGKDATFIISNGDILDMRTHQVTAAFIKGKEVSLNDKQKELYQKYMVKYNLK